MSESKRTAGQTAPHFSRYLERRRGVVVGGCLCVELSQMADTQPRTGRRVRVKPKESELGNLVDRRRESCLFPSQAFEPQGNIRVHGGLCRSGPDSWEEKVVSH